MALLNVCHCKSGLDYNIIPSSFPSTTLLNLYSIHFIHLFKKSRQHINADRIVLIKSQLFQVILYGRIVHNAITRSAETALWLYSLLVFAQSPNYAADTLGFLSQLMLTKLTGDSIRQVDQ